MITRPQSRRALIVAVIGVVLFAVLVVLSLTVGARPISPGAVWNALVSPDASNPDHVVVLTQRVPRTVIGVCAGAALALAGTVMQGLTRNPFADPGLLGLNAGASIAVLGAITLFGLSTPDGFVWFAFLGAAASAVLVAAIGGRGPDRGGPAKLALTGAAVTAGLTAVTYLILNTNVFALDVYRYWSVGGLTSRGLDAVALVLPAIVVGAVLALASARGLDLMALGTDTASGLGHDVARSRMLGILATVLLCGGATAIAGPIVFLGLLVPHALRPLVGGSYRRLLALGMPYGAALLLLADILGRVVALPGEVQAGIVVAVIGAPLLIALVLQPRRSML
ncbi:iron chelate uptake ABC transporter family permease subunit [Microbacterium sp. VKM Ac-2870]|nr:iron chelate uptake ABC transporter family permease subunit [Microbacterium sp. VKM Ac-2870]